MLPRTEPPQGAPDPHRERLSQLRAHSAGLAEVLGRASTSCSSNTSAPPAFALYFNHAARALGAHPSASRAPRRRSARLLRPVTELCGPRPPPSRGGPAHTTLQPARREQPGAAPSQPPGPRSAAWAAPPAWAGKRRGLVRGARADWPRAARGWRGREGPAGTRPSSRPPPPPPLPRCARGLPGFAPPPLTAGPRPGSDHRRTAPPSVLRPAMSKPPPKPAKPGEGRTERPGPSSPCEARRSPLLPTREWLGFRVCAV